MAVRITRRPDDEVATELKASRGPLAGARLAVKDNVNVAGLPTTAACPEFAYTPDRDAAAVAALRAAGAVVVGKTNLDQFATGLVGTRSPYGAVPDIRRREILQRRVEFRTGGRRRQGRSRYRDRYRHRRVWAHPGRTAGYRRHQAHCRRDLHRRGGSCLRIL